MRPGIEGIAYHVVVDAVLLHIGEEYVRHLPVASEIDMQHYLHARVHSPDGGSSGVEILAEFLPAAAVTLLLAEKDPPVGPEDAVAHLIADLDYLRQRAGLLEGPHDAEHIAMERLHPLLMVHVLERSGRGLRHGVGPSVRHHEVEREMIAVFPELRSPFENIVQVLTQGGRLVAYHEPAPVVAVAAENAPRVGRRPVNVIVLASGLLGLEHEGQVESESIRILKGKRGRGAQSEAMACKTGCRRSKPKKNSIHKHLQAHIGQKL